MLRLKAPAKINLFLNVLKKRPDGYHDLHTLFERIALFDEIRLVPLAAGIEIRTNSKEIPKNSKNICYRAAELIKNEFHVKKGVRIEIRKNIPVQAGLGGGSSDAATVLMGLNRLWKLGISRKKLIKLGGRLGSDVPFFLMESPFAVGTGRGEILKPVRGPKRKIWHVLVKPPFGISTKKAYQALRPSALTPLKGDVTMTFRLIEKADSKHLPGALTNSLENVLNKRVRTILDRTKSALLHQGALASLMSGSGSSVFGIFCSKTDALSAARFLKKNKRWRVFVAATY